MPALPYDQVVTPTLLRRFELEAEVEEGDASKYYAVVMRDDGNLAVWHPTSPSLDSAQLLWAGRLLKLLNRELHHDGAWVVVFTHPSKVSFESVAHAEPRSAYYMRYGLIWLDKDGDPQFTQEWLHGNNVELQDFTAVVLAGIESTAQKCAGAWDTWNVMMNHVLERKQADTFKRAKGERAPSAA